MNQMVDFRQILSRELENRLCRNPQYSMRAFAKDLKMAPPVLSLVLNGKKGLSRVSASKIAKRLGLTHDETEKFLDLVESQCARSKAVKAQAANRLKAKMANGSILKFLNITNDQFSLVAEWYHFPILELMRSPRYRQDETWIAKRLKIHSNQVKSALERMQNLGLIEWKNKRFHPKSECYQIPDGIPSGAVKQCIESGLRLANAALFEQSVEERDFRWLTLRCGKKDVVLVRERMKNFLRDLDAELSLNQDGNEIYQLNTQFFALTESE